MRHLVAALALLCLLSPTALASEPPLIGFAPGSTTIGPLDADLRPVAGVPTLPPLVYRTLSSPSGRRFIASNQDGQTLYDTATGKRLRHLAIDDPGVWPAERYVSTYSDGYQTLDLRTGKLRVRKASGQFIDMKTVGRNVWLLLRGNRGYRVHVFSFAGKPVRTIAVPPAPVSDFTIQIHGRILLYIGYGTSASFIAHSGDVPQPLGLAGKTYLWVGNLLVDPAGGHAAIIDHRTLAPVKQVDVAPGQFVSPYRGGFVLGRGRQVWDGALHLVADNPAAENAAQPYAIVHGDRLYDREVNCDVYSRSAVITDILTGTTVARLPGDYGFGVLGAGALDTANDGDCD